MGILQVLVLIGRPLVEQDCSGIFPTEIGSHSGFKGPAEQHGCTVVLLLPAVEIAMPITTRASEVLADLSVAVGHSSQLRVLQISWAEFFPTPGSGKAVQSD